MPSATNQPDTPPTRLPFPPLTTSHILACSYHTWHPLLRAHTPKARTIPLTQPFLTYLRADGIILPSDTSNDNVSDSGYSDSDSDSPDPAENWRGIHDSITSTIAELGGKVVPKLNWSAPKDATWMSTTNDMVCTSANDVYLLLKSSDFITHDLEHAFDECVDSTPGKAATIPYHLVLRKSFNLNPALEFRCFVRNRKLIAISQREMNYFHFLFDQRTKFKYLIQNFLDDVVLKKFEEENFVMDVYIPPKYEKCWLIDINPWAVRTDPLLFSWLELLRMEEPVERTETIVRLRIQPNSGSEVTREVANGATREQEDSDETLEEESDEEDVQFEPEFRLVQKDDPEAYQFGSTQYSAHKLPRDVVEASMTPEGMKTMMEEWQRIMQKTGDVSDDDSDA